MGAINGILMGVYAVVVSRKNKIAERNLRLRNRPRFETGVTSFV